MRDSAAPGLELDRKGAGPNVPKRLSRNGPQVQRLFGRSLLGAQKTSAVGAASTCAIRGEPHNVTFFGLAARFRLEAMALILTLLIGAGLGAVLGYYGKCTTGTCPLTANPWRGAIYGMVLAFLFHSALGRDREGSAAAPTVNVKPVTQTQFDSEIGQSNLPVVVDFYASWCGPCKSLSPVLDELAGPLTNRIAFLKVDVDQSPELAQRYRIEGVPTLLFLRAGKELDRQIGLTTKEALSARLNSFAAPAGNLANRGR